MYHQLAMYYDELMQLDYTEYLAVWNSLTDFTGKDVLEIGCGTGNVTERLLPRVQSIDATDSSEEMLMLAQRKIRSPKCRFFLAEDDLFLSEKRYDMIGLFVDVVNYVSPAEFPKLLQQWGKQLKPNGEIVFDVSNEAKLSQTLGHQIYRFETDEAEIFWVNEYDEPSKCLDFSVIVYTPSGDLFERSEEFHRQYVYQEEYIRLVATDYFVTAHHEEDRSFYRLRKTNL